MATKTGWVSLSRNRLGPQLECGHRGEPIEILRVGREKYCMVCARWVDAREDKERAS